MGLPGAMVQISQHLHPVATQMPLLRESLQQHAEGVGVVLPVEERGDLRVGLIRKLGVNRADRSADRKLLIEVERLAGDDVDRTGDATFNQRCLGALVHDDLVDELRRQQRVAHAAANLTTWLSTNQSPDATLWPLSSVCVRLGFVPRMLIRSFSSKPPSFGAR